MGAFPLEGSLGINAMVMAVFDRFLDKRLYAEFV
jgi:hypothetical protein